MSHNSQLIDLAGLPDDALVPRKDVAALLGVTPRTLYNWRREGRGPAAIAVEGVVRYRAGTLRKLIREGAAA